MLVIWPLNIFTNNSAHSLNRVRMVRFPSEAGVSQPYVLADVLRDTMAMVFSLKIFVLRDAQRVTIVPRKV